MNKFRLTLLSALLALAFVACQKAEVNEEKAAATATTVFATGEDMAKDAMTRITQVTPQEAEDLMKKADNYILLDVRQPDEVASIKIPGSVNIPRGVLEFRINKAETWEKEGLYAPEKNTLIVIYCKKGDRGALSAESLMKMGFTNVKSVKGGIVEWEKVFPENVEKTEAPAGEAAVNTGGC